MLSIHPVRSRRDGVEFVRVPQSIYLYDSLWVQPPNMVVSGDLEKNNPFYRDGVGEAFVVRRHGRSVGRIMAHVWKRHHRLHAEQVGYFGFFECKYDPEAAALLLQTAAGFVRDHQCHVIRGPFNMTGAQEAGILTSGFDRSPAVDMVYTAPWYPTLLEQNGFRKCLEMQTRTNDDLTSLEPDQIPTRYKDNASTSGVRLRCLSSLRRHEEMDKVRDVVNAAFLGNWGFVPITHQEWELQTGALLPILDPSLVILATVQDIAVGVTLAVPDFNRVFRKTAGRLFHPAALSLFGRSKLKEVVVILCAVRKQYQGLGISRLMNAALLRSIRKSGYKSLSTTWIGGQNTPSLASSDAFGMTARHTLAMYERGVE